MSDAWRNDPATEKQKEKLGFFGCTWDEGITKGQASDALNQCVEMLPHVEEAWQKRPATAEQIEKLQSLGCEPENGLTYGEAKELIEFHKLEEPTEDQKYLEYLDSEAGQIDEQVGRINFDWEDDYREVTREEVAQAWALVKTRKPGPPDTIELLDALVELFPDFRPKS